VSPEPVAHEIAALRALLDRDGSDELRRHDARARLLALRELWKREPARFDPAAIAALREIATAIEGPRRATLADGPRPGLAAARAVLADVFGYPSFRPGQGEVIEAVLAGRDCVAIMPTGAGKSLTYQIPARVLGGTTLVISPLIALMKDQVDAMAEVGLRATFLNSTLTYDQRRERVAGLWRGEYELVYAAPEGIEASAGGALSRARLSLIAVDEAHCISQWGHDFRPAYRNLAGLKRRFGEIPILALTATATPNVTRDIVEQLALRAPVHFRGEFFRPNLRISTYKKGEDAGNVREQIVRVARSHRGDSGIVYCLSRKATEATAEHLRAHGVRALAYHAGLDGATRAEVQDRFQRDDVDAVVATIAFGMGIDKSNVRYVIHRDMPRSIEAYYQEIGRAGRDGLPSDCVLFYSWPDVLAYDRFTDDVPAEVAAAQRRQAREMFDLASNRTCRHQAIARYFGEALPTCDGACDVCRGGDLLDGLPTVGRPIRARGGKDDRGGRTGGKPPRRGARRPSPRSAEAREGGRGKRYVSLEELEAGLPRQPEVASPPPADSDDALFVALKTLRKEMADARKVPAYIIFNDATLRAMANLRPRTEDDLRAVPGVGPRKLATYGAHFLRVLRGDT
jgi:ATP-dependent DNA helicase RecQ